MTGRFDLEAGQEWLDGRFSHFTVWLACNSGLKPAFGLLELRFAACPVMVHIPIIAGKHQGTRGGDGNTMGNKSFLVTTTFLSGLLVSGLAVQAADINSMSLPAVSAINGKIEFGAGWADTDYFKSDELVYGAGSISLPLGESFGLQIDGAAKNVFGDTFVGGAGHLFMRDPNSYLVGGIAGAADMGGASVLWGGGEAEFYLDRVSLELAGGYMNVDPDGGSSKDKAFVFADAAFYPVDNLRLAIGASSVAGFESAHLTGEYLLSDMPLSLKAEVAAGEDDFVSGSVGLSFYFGGNESSKSLIRRHREDDPRNRVLDIFGSAASAGFNKGKPVVEGPESCPEGTYWDPELNICVGILN